MRARTASGTPIGSPFRLTPPTPAGNMRTLSDRDRHLRRSLVALFAAGVLACVVGACSRDRSPSVKLRGERFAVEVADTPAKQRVGLMFRESMPADSGMLFVFPNAAPRGFWMRNCLIPLDILYFDAERRLLRAYHSLPPCEALPCETYPSGGRAQYVLELNAGVAKRLGVEPGDELELRIDVATE